MEESEFMIDYKSIFEKYLVPPGDFAACYAFSIHKAGSSLMYKMIGEVCRATGIPALNIPGVLFEEGVFENVWGNDRGVLELIAPGRIYFGFRNFPSVLLDDQVKIREKKCVLLVRDPRDALVSQFYSFGGKHVSHKMPKKNAEAFLEKARGTEDLDIDDYVLKTARNHLNKLIAYKDSLDFSNVLLCRYEDVYFDKRGFLSDIFEHFDITVPPKMLDRIAERNDIRPAAEDVTKHIRQGLPGDHANKLRPVTIRRLNEMFSEICAWYGYKLQS